MEHHPEGIFLEADTYNALVKTIQRDCRVLESFKIMDYSLLLGIHNLDQAAREKVVQYFSFLCISNCNKLIGFTFLISNHNWFTLNIVTYSIPNTQNSLSYTGEKVATE